MWFLWGLITFLIVTFSTSQIISYIVCFLRYPVLMSNMPDKNKNWIVGGLILHFIINIIWIILICTINIINQYYIAILISTAIALFFSIDGISHDPNLYQNFKKLTGAEEREKIKDKVG